MIFITWCFITDPGDDIVACFKRKLKIEDPPENTIPPEDTAGDTPDANKTCSFEGEDLTGGYVYSLDGSLVSEQPNIDCSECTKYVYKDKSGSCYAFIHDAQYNADRICDEDEGEQCKDACTAKFTPLKGCPF